MVLRNRVPFLAAILAAAAGPAFAQTDPTPHNAWPTPFTFTNWDSTSPASTYPANMVFHTSATQDPVLATASTANYTGVYNGTSGTRMNGLGTNGFAWINTGTNGFLGEALVGLDTTGRQNVLIDCVMGTNTVGAREYRVRMQYRIGNSGAWLDTTPVTEYTSNAVAGHSTTFTDVALPPAVNNQPVVQVRWKYYFIAGSGTRPQLRVDDINITSDVLSGNVPPVVTNGVVSPPQSTTTAFNVSVDASDSDGTVAGVNLHWRVGGSGGFTSSPMTLTSGTASSGTWSLDLDAATTLVTGSNINYYFEAVDDDSAASELFSSSTPATRYVNDRRPASGEVVINEIMYNPDDVTQSPDATGEWIELRNNAAQVRDVSLYTLDDDTAGAGLTLPIGTTIPPGGYLLLVKDTAGFNSVPAWVSMSSGTAIIGGFGPNFGNSPGDSVVIYDDNAPAGTLDQVDYQNIAPWPTVNVGTGASLEKRDPAFAGNVATNWASDAVGNTNGSPGQFNFAAYAPAVTPGSGPTVAAGSSTTGATVASISDTLPGTFTVAALPPAPPAGVTVNLSTSGSNVIADVTATCVAPVGPFNLDFRVTDADGHNGDGTITITIGANQNPTIGSYANVPIASNSGTTNSPLAAPADPETSIASVVASPATLGGAGSVSVTNATTGEVTIDTTGVAPATYPITVTVTDNCGNTAQSNFDVIVSPAASVGDWFLQ